MKCKPNWRRWLLAAAFLVAIGYLSASLSLHACNAAARAWLAEDAPAGARLVRRHVEPARLFLPFTAAVPFEKNFQLAPMANDEFQLERGTRYYVTLFGLAVPVWTASQTSVWVVN